MEQRKSFETILSKVENRADQLRDQITVTKNYCQCKDMQMAYHQAIRMEEIAERLVLLTRVLPAYTGSNIAVLEVNNIMKLCIPIEIGFTEENWFSLRIPVILPKKSGGSADYIRSFLYPVMRDYFRYKEPVRYRDCVLIYRHVYSRDRPERQKRDHDNIETNMVSDIVAMYVMSDDAPDTCSHYYCSAKGTEERTEVYVVPKTDFQLWLSKENGMPEEGIQLYDEVPDNEEKHM